MADTAPSSGASLLSSPSVQNAVDALLAHPELISAVASALGVSRGAPPAENGEAPKNPSPKTEIPASAHAENNTALPDLGAMLGSIAPLIAPLRGGSPEPKKDPRACLLQALKPYVSPARRDAIDTMIRLARLTELIRQSPTNQ